MKFTIMIAVSVFARSAFFLLACGLLSFVFFIPVLSISNYIILPLLSIFPMMLAIAGLEILPPSILRTLGLRDRQGKSRLEAPRQVEA